MQAAQYEGLVVWINALIAGAGGQIVDEQGDVLVNDTAKRAAEIESKLANSPAAPPGMSTNREDRLASASMTAAPTTWSTTRTSIRVPRR